MPKLTVMVPGAARAIPFSPGVSVREVLEGAGVLVRTACRGNGACGLCVVQVEAGDGGSLTQTERLVLSPVQLSGNCRLACQLLPENDLDIRIVNPALSFGWRDLARSRVPYAPSALHPAAGRKPADPAYGLAVDLGTTQISVSLWDLKHGRRRFGRVGPNPQSGYGADVVTRLMAASESDEDAGRLARMPLEAIAAALRQMCAQDGVALEAVCRAAIVGNTAMLVLLTGTDSQQLLQPDHWTRAPEFRVEPTVAWASVLGIDPQAEVELISPLAGFVGSDLLAGVIATRLTERAGSLLIDFGTNSEMALWDGNRLWVTSAAGGPAFEGCGMQCGMPAEFGAIYRFAASRDSGGFQYEVLGGTEARGFCGSGIVDLIAYLRESGELTRLGTFPGPLHQEGYTISSSNPAIRLTKRDVDIFQRAKAAIGTGIGALLTHAGLSAAELSRVCVCGVFGENLNVRNAQRIGLVPDIPPERIELCGNTALAGCEYLLLSPAGAAELASLRERAVVVNLSQASDFNERFLENLYLEPLKGESHEGR
jgi:uncharacterized 2Fe-2S/4Fe-4S cluster protein (DUF4445 family)